MSQSMEISWINNAKVICLMLVYMYHSSVYSGFETDTLYSFYSPFFTCAFFFISGYLIFWKQLNPQLLSVRSLQWLVGGGQKDDSKHNMQGRNSYYIILHGKLSPQSIIKRRRH